MSAQIIPFAPRIIRKREPVRSPSIAFRLVPPRDGLTMDSTDTVPCDAPSQDPPGNDFKNG